MKIIEVSKKNWEYYKEQMLRLEEKVKNDMIKQDVGDLFFTTGEDIKDYAYDPRHHVYVMVDKNDRVIAQTYLIGAGSHIQGDYSDLPKYFTMGEDFLQYVRHIKYENEEDFIHACNSVYSAKIYAFKYALRKIYGSEDYSKFMENLISEKTSSTHFDERTDLRRKINKYMSEFMSERKMSELYRQFYNVDSAYANYKDEPEAAHAYDSFISASKVTVYDKKIENSEEYFEANVYNTIEVDTYITDPEARKHGAAKILSTLALNKTINEFFNSNNDDTLYLSITLHKDNYLSENIANFLGFKDYIDLERRSTIERKAYMKRIDRNTYKEYLAYLNKKLTYFYGYGNEVVTEEEKELFDMEKEMHNREIALEIDNRMKNGELKGSIKDFVMNFRNSLNEESEQISHQRRL